MSDSTAKIEKDIARVATALEGINYSLAVLAMGTAKPVASGRPQHSGQGVVQLLEAIAKAVAPKP